MSVYLTDTPLFGTSFPQASVNKSPNQNKVDQFLSTLHSIQKIEFYSAEIYFELAYEYSKFKNQIIDQIKKCIPNASIYFSRLECFNAWKVAASKIPSSAQIVLLKSNHDHVFLPNNTNGFYQFLFNLSSFGEDFIGEITHWPEFIGDVHSRSWKVNSNSNSNSNERYFVTTTTNSIGTCVISPAFFKSWWVNDFTNGSKIVRPDNPFGPSVIFAPIKRVIPTTEFFRHLDGPAYRDVTAPVSGPLRACCTVNSSVIKHTDWTYGNFLFSRIGKDLPIQPNKSEVNSVSILINQILLMSARKVNLKNIYYISNSHKYKLGKFAFLFSFVCILNKHFFGKIFNLLLPIRTGNLYLYTVRCYFVNIYKTFQKSHPKLPVSVRDLLLLKLKK
jgi:hypothetical protein